MTHIRIGSRESRLAVIQAELVRDALEAANPGLTTEIVTYKTTGDKILDVTLDKIGGKGLFTKELEQALLEDRVDLLVHSFKDVPMEVDPRIPLVGVTAREDSRDALVLPEGTGQLDLSKPIGCSSKRRTLQFRALYPEAEVLPVRGNVLTRLRKLDGGEFGALILAAAGLKRLGLEHRISGCFSPAEMLPAACQGILALQARADFDCSVLAGVCDAGSWTVALAERAFVRTLDGGCSSPVAAHGVLEGGILTLTGLYVAPDSDDYHIETASGDQNIAEALGISLALACKERWGA